MLMRRFSSKNEAKNDAEHDREGECSVAAAEAATGAREGGLEVEATIVDADVVKVWREVWLALAQPGWNATRGTDGEVERRLRSAGMEEVGLCLVCSEAFSFVAIGLSRLSELQSGIGRNATHRSVQICCFPPGMNVPCVLITDESSESSITRTPVHTVEPASSTSEAAYLPCTRLSGTAPCRDAMP
eukprot:474486-Rhodomonas_salina.4